MVCSWREKTEIHLAEILFIPEQVMYLITWSSLQEQEGLSDYGIVTKQTLVTTIAMRPGVERPLN